MFVHSAILYRQARDKGSADTRHDSFEKRFSIVTEKASVSPFIAPLHCQHGGRF
jgi:hypothetical protein